MSQRVRLASTLFATLFAAAPLAAQGKPVPVHRADTIRAYHADTISAYHAHEIQPYRADTIRTHRADTVRAYQGVPMHSYGGVPMRSYGGVPVRAYGQPVKGGAPASGKGRMPAPATAAPSPKTAAPSALPPLTGETIEARAYRMEGEQLYRLTLNRDGTFLREYIGRSALGSVSHSERGDYAINGGRITLRVHQAAAGAMGGAPGNGYQSAGTSGSVTIEQHRFVRRGRGFVLDGIAYQPASW